MTDDREEIIAFAYEAVLAGVEQLNKYVPGKDDPFEAVIRIYLVMEMTAMRLDAEMSDTPDTPTAPIDKKLLN